MMNGENTNRNRSDSMPHVTWLEGVLDYLMRPSRKNLETLAKLDLALVVRSSACTWLRCF